MGARRLILTGAPGTGKSTLLAALAAAGWATSPEVSRAIIREQQAQGGRLTPWQDLAGFLTVCATRMKSNRERATANGVTIYDRAEPDLAAYARWGGAVSPLAPPRAGTWYEAEVLYAPLWPEIFTHDAQRCQTWADAVALDRCLRDVYRELGYTLRELPRVSVSERLAWVEQMPAFSGKETSCPV